jgi:hypothetical protein
MPDIEFVNSPRTEQERLKMTKKVIVSGFYAKHGFVVVPDLEDMDPNSSVVYPRKFDFVPIETKKIAKEWEGVGEQFWLAVEQYFPGCMKRFEKLEVRLTRYGTVASGDRLQEKLV